MVARSGRKNRCISCQMNRPLCVCAEIAQVRAAMAGNYRGRVLIPMHAHERKLPTNTARLAVATLPDCEIRIRGLLDSATGVARPMDGRGFFEEGRKTLFLFPSEDARELTPELARDLADLPYTLVVPDGSWRQARKVAAREPLFRDQRERVQFVKLPPGPPSNYHLRRETLPENVCTFEAIARAIGVLEGPARGPEIQARLEAVFDLVVERSLWARGKILAQDCRHPIPQTAYDYFHTMGCRGSMTPEERALTPVVFG